MIPKVQFSQLVPRYHVGVQNLLLNVEGDNFARISTKLTGECSLFALRTQHPNAWGARAVFSIILVGSWKRETNRNAHGSDRDQ